MRNIQEIFDAVIACGAYNRNGYMCLALYEAENKGFIDTSEYEFALNEIEKYQAQIFPGAMPLVSLLYCLRKKNPEKYGYDTSHTKPGDSLLICLPIYKDWDNRPFKDE